MSRGDRGVDVTFIGAGKLGVLDNALVAFALGVDMVNVAREAMMAIGCIQSQKCPTDRCPTGVATQDPWLARGLDPSSKAERCAQYVRIFRRELVTASEAVGVAHPGLITADVDIFRGDYEAQSLPRGGLRLQGRLGSAGPVARRRDHRADATRRQAGRDPLQRGGRGREAPGPGDRDGRLRSGWSCRPGGSCRPGWRAATKADRPFRTG